MRTHLEQPQLIVMGRVTYQVLSRLSPSSTDELHGRMTELPKLVFSSTIEAPLTWKNTRLVKGEAAEEIRALKRQPGDPIRSIGSVGLVKSMIQLSLVDRLRVIVFPLIAGSAGRAPLYAGYSQTGLELIDSNVLDSRLVVLEYRPGGTSPPLS